MAQRGRPRKPKEIKLAQGTFRPDREFETLKGEKLETVPDAPKFLIGRSIYYFENICKVLLDFNILSSADILLITQLAQALDLNEQAYNMMKTQEPVQVSSTGFETISGWYSVYEKTSKQIRELSNLFGLNPSARERFKIIEPKEEVDDITKLLSED